MGQFADGLLSGVKEKLGISGDEQDAAILEVAQKVQSQVEVLTGYLMEPSGPVKFDIDPGGLPFVPTVGLQSASVRAETPCWPITDSVNPVFASVLQVAEPRALASDAVPRPLAVCAAAALLAEIHRSGWLSVAPGAYFVARNKTQPGLEFARQLMDSGRYTHVPVAKASVPGWWIQVSRRLAIVTNDTPNDPFLVELLAPPGDGLTVVAGEPTVIIAHMTTHPSDWAMAIRVWVEAASMANPPQWRVAARAVHHHGLPIICLDAASTPEEVVAQMLLAAYWHGYIDADEAVGIPGALAAAFPLQVARVLRGTGASGTEAAAALLFERLLSPGFDPTRGAGSVRRYIARHATTLIREHRSALASDHPWQEFEITERHYYKLLAKFARKGRLGRYEIDDAINAQIQGYLAERKRREAAMAFLRLRGFSDPAARKWLQRNDLETIESAQPRRPVGTE